MEIFTIIISAILSVLLGYFVWNVQRLTNVISDLQKEFNNFSINAAGAAVSCKTTHQRIDEKLTNHEGRIQKLEEPVKKNRKRR